MPNLTARQMLSRIPVRMAVGGEARAFSDDEVKQFIQSTYAQFGGPGVEAHKAIADAMAQYGVGVNQVARATGYTPREVEAEFMGQRAGERPVLDDPTGTAAGMSAAYRAAAQAGGQQTVDDYYANLRKDAEAYLANPNAPTGVDAYNQLIQSGISTSDLRAAGVADAVLDKIFTVDAPIAQSQFVTPAGMTSAYERSPDLAFESQRLTALGQDGRGILDAQGRDYIANLQKDGIDAAERAQMLEYATERGYSFDDLLKAGVDPNVLFRDDGSAAAKAAADKATADAAAKAAADAAAATAEAERRRQADLAAAEAERNRLMDIRIAEEAERARQAAEKAAADKAAADKAAADKAAEEKLRREQTLIGCPSPEMRILLSDGSLKAAGELQVGDKVHTQHEHSEQWGDHEVTRVSLIQDQPRLVLRFADGDFVCSHSHKFYKAGQWVEANSVAAGDDLSGKTVLKVLDGTEGTVVSITVDEAHTYVCEGLLSHNKSPDTSAEDAARKAAEDAAAKAAADKAAADAAVVAPGVTTGDIVKAVTPTGPTAAELQAAIDAANAKAAQDAANAKAAREAQEAAERAQIAATTGAAVAAVTPSYSAQQLQDIIKAAESQPAAAGTVANPIDTRGSAATGSQSGVSKFLETYTPASPFVAPAYTAPTVYQPLPAQPDMFAAGQPALDTTFNQSPRTAIFDDKGKPTGQFDYSPAAKLRSATGSGFTFTPPSITTRPRSLLSPREIQAYGGTMSASQRFAQNRALIDRNLRDMLASAPALRNASTYNLLRNRVMAGEFGADPARVFNPETPEGQKFQAFLASLGGAAPTTGAATGATTGTVADAAGTGQTSTAGSTVAGGYAAPIDAQPLMYGGYRLEEFSKGGAVKKSKGSAKDELARFQEGGAVSARRPLSPNDPLYITEDASVSADELLRRQLEGIDNAPSARTPATDYLQTESRSMLDRLKGAGSAVNRAFYENISKPAVGAAVDMTVGLGDLAQMGARYLGNRAGFDAGEFTPAAPRVRETLGAEGYDPYALGSIATQVLPFAAAGRAATSAPTAARQLESMFPNLGRESGAYVGGETAAAAAREVMPGSTAAELLAGVAGGMGGGFGGSALDAPTMSRMDAPTGDEPPAGSAASMLEGLSAPAAPAPPVIGSSVIYRSPGSDQKSALDAIKNIAQARAGEGAKAKIKIEDIANFHQQNHLNTYGRQLDQFNDDDFNSAVDAAVDEVRYQLGQAESGKGWYDADVRKTFEVASKIPGLSDLGRSETDRVIMSAIMAPTSIGQYVPGNTRSAIASMLQYKRTGSVPTTPPAAGTITEGIQNAGWGVKQQSVAAGMRVINHLLNKFGPDGFADWWLSPHTLKEMTTLRKEAGLSGAPSGLGGGQNSMHLGAMILGDKTGRFSLNINGYEGTTKDVWFSRSYNRHFGNMFGNDGEVAGGPRNIKERQRMEEFTKKIQERLKDQGLSEQDIQAILWYYEQNLMTDLGVTSRPQAFSQEAERIYGNLRPTVRAGDEAQIAAQQTGLEGFRGVSASQRAVRAERRFPGRVDPRDPSRATGPYEAGAGEGYETDGLLRLSPRPDSLGRYQAAGLNIPAVSQVPSQESAARYSSDMASAMSRHPLGAQVEIKSPEDLAQARLFRTDDGSGFAVKPDGDIVAVFAGQNAKGGSGYSMLQAAVAAGGRKLDAFDTYLPKIYETVGFRPVARLPWNDEYAPPGWNKETFAKYNNGEPDVVFFVHDPEYFGGAKDVPVVNEYDQAVALQDDALRQLSTRTKPEGFAKGGAVTSSRRMLDNLIGKKPEGQRVDATGLLGFANGGEARVGGSAPAVAGRTGRAARLAAQRAADPQTESRTMLERLGRFTSLDTPQDMGLGETAADIGMGFLPVVGTAQGARDFERARRDEDKLGMLLSAASMIPVAGGAVRAIRSAGKAADVVEEVPGAARQMLDEVAPPAAQLDMSEAARIQRAAEQGFDVSKPLYHGTDKNFDEFITRKGLSGKASYFTPDPDVASAYAMGDVRFKKRGPGATVMPVYVRGNILDLENLTRKQEIDIWKEIENYELRTAKPGTLKYEMLTDNKFPTVSQSLSEITDEEYIPDYAQMMEKLAEINMTNKILEKLGYAGVKGREVLLNPRGTIGDKEYESIAIFDPSNIRSVNAAFDPSELASPVITKAKGGLATKSNVERVRNDNRRYL